MSISSANERESMYELAVDAGKRSLDAQRDELNGMRTRAVAFSAIILTGTAFLVGAGLTSASRTAGFYILAIIGTALFGIMLALVLLMVLPALKFQFILLPGVLMDWIEGSAPAPSKAVMMRQLAKETMPAMLERNERSLSIVRRWYRFLLIVGFLTIGVWIYFTWAVR